MNKNRKSNDNYKTTNDRFEFVLYVNDNIVCQRIFSIVDFNENFIKSRELKEMMDSICGTNIDDFGGLGLIPNHLKSKSINYLWQNYDPYQPQTEETYKAPPKKGDNLKFEFKVDKKVVGSAIFPNDYFTLTPTVFVDIREIVVNIINEIRRYSTQKKYVMVTKENFV